MTSAWLRKDCIRCTMIIEKSNGFLIHCFMFPSYRFRNIIVIAQILTIYFCGHFLEVSCLCTSLTETVLWRMNHVRLENSVGAARKFRRSVCAAQKLSDGMLGIMAGSVTKLKCVINVTLDCNCCNLSESPV